MFGLALRRRLLQEFRHLASDQRGLKQKARLSIVLKQDVEDLGEAGDVVEVRHGYARNFLIPKKQAVIATHATRTRFAKSVTVPEEKPQQKPQQSPVEKDILVEVLRRLTSASVDVPAKVLIGARLHEPLAPAAICKATAAALQVMLPEELLDIKEAIYQVGTYSVPLKILDADGQQALLRVTVVAE